MSYLATGGAALITSLSLDVAAGERFAIIGPNGAGKTTLLQLLSGRLRPASGSILLNGVDVARLDRRKRAQLIAVMAQSDHPDQRLKGHDYVALGRTPHLRSASPSSHSEVVARALDTAGAADFAGRPLSELSGGERQKLALARALAQEPAVLLLDEPTNNLDLRARADLIGLAAELGITVVAVLHDLALAPDFADRIAVMSQGQLICCAPPEEALSETVIRRVFDMSVLRLPHPCDNRSLLVFEKPLPEEIAI
ncbi:MAG: ABC transporter ATP-binding protein [Pseudomonadota bacterium]